MIITKREPFNSSEVAHLREVFDTYIKTVIDIERKVCSAGCDRHYESEQLLLAQGSKQSDIWGGGIDLESKIIDFNSFINIRPSEDNKSNEIQDSELRKKYEELTKFFFEDVL